mmetsp:Transcript_1549/g.4201  ORF Transcript_1549/g.4201 Transcript_1549/m.4201 type:complete len:341 (-) Transcript_1549:38-1060(-)
MHNSSTNLRVVTSGGKFRNINVVQPPSQDSPADGWAASRPEAACWPDDPMQQLAVAADWPAEPSKPNKRGNDISSRAGRCDAKAADGNPRTLRNASRARSCADTRGAQRRDGAASTGASGPSAMSDRRWSARHNGRAPLCKVPEAQAPLAAAVAATESRLLAGATKVPGGGPTRATVNMASVAGAWPAPAEFVSDPPLAVSSSSSVSGHATPNDTWSAAAVGETASALPSKAKACIRKGTKPAKLCARTSTGASISSSMKVRPNGFRRGSVKRLLSNNVRRCLAQCCSNAAAAQSSPPPLQHEGQPKAPSTPATRNAIAAIAAISSSGCFSKHRRPSGKR